MVADRRRQRRERDVPHHAVRQDILDLAWTSFRRDCIPAEAGAVQVEELRRSFYSGAHAVIETCRFLGGGGVPQDVSFAILDSLTREVGQFLAELLEDD